MKLHVFKTKREFENKFPNKFYICCICGYMTPDKYTCPNCGFRANGLFKTMGKGYKYKIIETGKTEEIFKPIEEIERRMYD